MNRIDPVRAAWAAALVLAVAVPLAAQCAPPSWSEMNAVNGTDRRVAALERWDPDGAGPLPAVVVAGGDFGFAGNVAAARIASWDGTGWSALGSGMGPASAPITGIPPAAVNALAAFRGELVAAGRFTTAGGLHALNIARWDGVAWRTLGSGLNGPVAALAVYGGELVAGGSFTGAGGQACDGLARWDGRRWRPLGSFGVAAGARVRALAVHNGELLVGGSFAAAAGTPASHVVRWNGAAWLPLSGGITGPGAGDPVCALASHAGSIVVGGAFSSAGGVAASNVASWDGSAWHALGAGTSGAVLSLRSAGGALIAGGSFATAGGAASAGLARWDGTSWSSLQSGTTGGSGSAPGASPVEAILDDGPGFYAAGTYQSVGNAWVSNVARWDGAAWSGLGPAAVRGVVHALLSTGTGLIAGGYFALAGGAPCYSVASWDGSWHRMGAGLSLVTSTIAFGRVTSLAAMGNDVFAAGTFNIGPPSANPEIARWDGTSWQSFGAGMADPRIVGAHGGDLIAAGSSQIQRWNGTSWSTVAAVLGGGGPASDIAVLAFQSVGTSLCVAGNFATINGVPASNIALWNGVSWSALGPGLPGEVRALTVHDGDLVAAGQFSNYPSKVARWDGTAWIPVGSGLSGTVRALGVADGALIAGGVNLQPGPAAHVLRWDGSAWTPIVSGPDNAVYAMADHEGGLIFGGHFIGVGTGASPSVARWSAPLPVFRASQPGGPGTPVAIVNRGLIAGREYYNVLSFDLCPGGPGSGPVGGLCFNAPNALPAQLALPVGAAPFHFIASATAMSFGPYALPAGLAFEALCFDATGGVLGCIGPVLRVVVP